MSDSLQRSLFTFNSPVNIDTSVEELNQMRSTYSTSFILSQHSDNLTSHSSKLSTLETDVGTLQGEVGTLQGDTSTLQGDVGTLQGDTSTLQGDVSTLQGDVSTLQTDVSGYQVAINSHNNTLGSHSYSIATLGTASMTQSAAIGILQSEVADNAADTATKADASTLSEYRRIDNNRFITRQTFDNSLDAPGLFTPSPLTLASTSSPWGNILLQVGADAALELRHTENESYHPLIVPAPTSSGHAATKGYVDSGRFTPAYIAMTLVSDDLTQGEIEFDTVSTSQGISCVSGDIAVDTAGTYMFTCSASFDTNVSVEERYLTVELKEDATTLCRALGQMLNTPDTGTEYASVSLSWIASAVTGKTYTFNWNSGMGGDADLDFRTHATVHRIA